MGIVPLGSGEMEAKMTAVHMAMGEPNFRLLFEACPHPYLVLLPNPAFTIVAVDDRYLAATHTQRAAILGRGLFEVFPDNPGDATATGVSDLRMSLDRVIRDGTADIMGVQKYDIPRRQQEADFEIRYWSPVNTPVFGADGAVAMIIHHVEDITDYVLAGGDKSGVQATRMQAEVLRRAAEVKAANRKIKAMMVEQELRTEQQREAELARMGERLHDLGHARAELLADIFRKIAIPQAWGARYGVAAAIFAAAMAIRLLVLPVEAGLPFVTFFPALAIAVFLCGLGPGLLDAALSLAIGYIVFMPPFWAIKLSPGQVPALTVFAVFSVLICLLIDRMLRAAGTTRHINRQLNTAMAALQQDAVSRKRTEQALRNSEENFRSAFENAAVGMALASPDGRWLQVNSALCRLLGYDEDELLQYSFKELTHPDDVESDLASIRQFIDGSRDSYRTEKRYIAKGGDIVWILLSVSVVRDATGAPLHFISQMQDITEGKAAERKSQRLARIVTMRSEGNQALIKATDELHLFQAMCQVVVQFGGYRMAWMGTVEHDEAKTIRPVAHAGHEAGYLAIAHVTWAECPLGAGPSGLSVRSGVPQINDDVTTNPAMSPWRQPALQRGYRSGISLPLKDRSGVFGVLTIYADEPRAFGPDEVKLLVDLAEDVAYGIATLRTRRDHDEMERTLFQAQKMESLGQLTGGIAHDFNNLLQVILSNLDLSLHRLGASTAITGYLQNAILGAEQGAKLTSQLLAFARRQPLRPEPVRVDRLVGDMTNLLRRSIGEHIDIELVTSGGLWTALVDSNQLQNALLNLAINARDSMPQGGKLTIELANSSLDASYAGAHREVKAGQYVMVALTDTGTGMAPDVLERAFEPFFTTKPEGAGTGLGLSMVYGFIKQSAGHINIYSEMGLGTTIKLYLPRTQDAAAQRVVEQTKAARGEGETILVAEDDDGVRASVVTQLAELGYRVLAAHTGEAALHILARGERVDLLFTDVVMPGALNGRALADRARAICPHLRVVFTSGYTENAIIHHGRLDQGVTLLSKPYRLAQLAETIRAALGPSVAEPESARQDHGGVPTTGAPVILFVEDDELIRVAISVSLEPLGYRVLATGKPDDALLALAADPAIRVLITDFGLPGMTGLALARQALAQRPDLPVILTTGHHLDAGDLPDPSIQIITKPFRPQSLHAAIEVALKRKRN